jgi:hypothetical protein
MFLPDGFLLKRRKDMLKRSAIAVVLIFLAWSAMDMVIHGVLLEPIYVATASLWRPMDQMIMPLMYFVTVVSAMGFTAIYALLVADKSLMAGIKLGLLFGIVAGVSMGFGSYSTMPIPISLAWGWSFGSLAEMVVAGAILGAVVKS